MALALLLPLLLGGAEPRVITTGDHHRVEQVMSDEVRARVEAGWSIADVRTLNDELVVTLSKGDRFEQHIVHFDRWQTYRVESDVKPPADLDEPAGFLVTAAGSPYGGIEIDASCGEYYLRPYLVDEHATGEFAPSLVARAIASADNLVNVMDSGGRVTFSVNRKVGGAMVSRELVVWLDPKGAVIEAQLRRFEWGGEGGSYQHMPELKKALAKTRVTAISKGALVTPKGRFVIDPDGSAFTYDGEEHGCGC